MIAVLTNFRGNYICARFPRDEALSMLPQMSKQTQLTNGFNELLIVTIQLTMFPAASLSGFINASFLNYGSVGFHCCKKEIHPQQRFVAKQLITNQHQVITKIALVIVKFFFCRRLRFLGGTNKMDSTSQRFLKFIEFIKLC